MRTVEEHETRLADRLRAALREEVPGVTLYAAPDGVRKTPTVAFRLEGHAPLEVCQHAADHGYFIAAWRLLRFDALPEARPRRIRRLRAGRSRPVQHGS